MSEPKVKRTKAQLVEYAQPLFLERDGLDKEVNETRQKLKEVLREYKEILEGEVRAINAKVQECNNNISAASNRFYFGRDPRSADFSVKLTVAQLEHGVARLENQIASQKTTLEETISMTEKAKKELANHRISE